MPHGLLFVLYIFLAYELSQSRKWPKNRLFKALAAAFLPFGTFVFDRRYLVKDQARSID